MITTKGFSEASDTMTSNLAAYARENGHNFAQVASKLATGIALAAIIVHAMTPAHAHWGNDEYSPIAKRIRSTIDGHTLSEGSPFWTFNAYLLIAIMRQEDRPLDLVATSDKAIVEGLLDLIG